MRKNINENRKGMKSAYHRRSIAKRVAAAVLAVTMLAIPITQAFAGEWVRTGTNWKYKTDSGAYLNSAYDNETFYIWDAKRDIGDEYVFDSSGNMRTGWVKMSSDWYYFYGDGRLAKETWIDGKYYVGKTGCMLTNTATPDGYYVGRDGAWMPGALRGLDAAEGKYIEGGSQVDSTNGYYEDNRYDGMLDANPMRKEHQESSAGGGAVLNIKRNLNGSVSWDIDGGYAKGVFTKNANGVYSGVTDVNGPDWNIDHFVVLNDGSIEVFCFSEGDGGYYIRTIFNK